MVSLQSLPAFKHTINSMYADVLDVSYHTRLIHSVCGYVWGMYTMVGVVVRDGLHGIAQA